MKMMIMKSQKKDMFFFENAVPVDLTEVTGMYDLYKKSDDEKNCPLNYLSLMWMHVKMIFH